MQKSIFWSSFADILQKSEANMTCSEITSRKNNIICNMCKLHDKKERDKTGLFLAEGIKLCREAILSRCSIEKLFYTKKALEQYCDDICSVKDVPHYLCSNEVFSKLSDENSPQGIICCIKKNAFLSLSEEDYKKGSFLILEDLQNPLNIGAIFRCAYSMGITKIIMTDKCADPYGTKAVRASMGSLFKVRLFYTTSISTEIEKIKMHNNNVYCTSLDSNSQKLGSFRLSPTDSIIIGNEGHGVSNDALTNSTGSLYIPMNTGAESLNAATAAAIILWEIKKSIFQ